MKASEIKPTKKEYDRLTTKQKLFIEYYLQTLNAKESAKKAGYVMGSKTPAVGTILVAKLKPYIDERLGMDKKIADTNEILEMLTRIARGEEKDAFGLDTSNQDKLKALELLGKANQMYVDRVKQDTSVDINVNLIGTEDNTVYIEGEKVEPLGIGSGEEEED